MNKELHIDAPTKVSDLLHGELANLDHEEVWCIFLTRALYVIKIDMLAKGTLSEVSFDSRTLLRQALLNNAAKLILVHNHPGGRAIPSDSDIKLTERIRTACLIFDISLVDHIINRTGTDWCPMEKLSRDIDDPASIITAIKGFFNQIGK